MEDREATFFTTQLQFSSVYISITSNELLVACNSASSQRRRLYRYV